MTKRLVIVESPSKAKTINKFLGKEYQVEASYGHVRDLPKSKMGIEVADSFKPTYIIPSKARKVVSQLKKAAKGKKEVFLAPDPDREGEAISWHLATILADDGRAIKRVEFNEITKDAVRRAFDHPRDINEKLVNAQQARRILDRIVGYELSPLLWKKVRRGLSAGRVQSVALRLIVDREREIKKFVPEEYWSLQAKLFTDRDKDKIFTAKLDRIEDKKIELKNEVDTLKIKKIIESSDFKVHSIDKKERVRRPQGPYTTSKLQQEAFNRLGFPAAKTMKVAQGLYEGLEIGEEGTIGLITYMRTDSVQVSKTAEEELIKFIQDNYGKDFLPESPRVYKSKKGAQEAHEAIRPTSVARTPELMRQYMDDDQFKLYDLIWRKFVASQMANAVDLVTSVDIVSAEKYFFKVSGTINVFLGFGKVFEERQVRRKRKSAEADEQKSDEEEEESKALPDLQEGEKLSLEELVGAQHFTKPPARFNDASLVKALEEDGIGRPSTYAPTIYTLLSRFYVQRKGGALMATDLGETVVDLLVQHFPTVLNLEFTAQMEAELDKIEDGELEWEQVLKDFYAPFLVDLEKAKVEMQNMKIEPVETDQICEKCGKKMVIRWGRFGKFIACPGFPECRNTKAISTGVKCPQENCGGELVKRKSRRGGPFYGCSNYPTCTYLVNELPKTSDESGEGKAASEGQPQA